MADSHAIGDHAIGDFPGQEMDFWDASDITEDAARKPVIAKERDVGCSAGLRVIGVVADERLIRVIA